MDYRFSQAHREARWAFALTLVYLLGWVLTAYLPGNSPGITGLPRWFEFSCLWLPLFFILLCGLMIRAVYREVPLDESEVVPDAD